MPVRRDRSSRSSGRARVSSRRAASCRIRSRRRCSARTLCVRGFVRPELRAGGGAGTSHGAHPRRGATPSSRSAWRASCTRPALRVYFSTDVMGVEMSGAVKNVMAIAAGISDGLGTGPERAGGADHPGSRRADAARRGAGRTDRDLHGTGGSRGPHPHLHRRSVAQPARRVAPRTGRAARRDTEAARPRRRRRVFGAGGRGARGRKSMWTCRSPGRFARCCFAGRRPREAVQQLLARDPRED